MSSSTTPVKSYGLYAAEHQCAISLPSSRSLLPPLVCYFVEFSLAKDRNPSSPLVIQTELASHTGLFEQLHHLLKFVILSYDRLEPGSAEEECIWGLGQCSSVPEGWVLGYGSCRHPGPPVEKDSY